MKWRAALWCLLAACAIAACAVQIARAGRLPLQTDLLALLPATEQDPVAEAAVRHLAAATGNRAVFLIGGTSSAAAAEGARAFAGSLRESRRLGVVVADVPPFDVRQWTDFYFRHRDSLLAPADRAALAQGSLDLEARLRQKLYAPFRTGLSAPLGDDPLGFADAWFASLPLRGLKLEPEQGLLVAHDGAHAWALVTAELSGSAYDGAVQRDVLNAVSDAEAELRQKFPQAELLRMGTVFYAGAARQGAEREVDLIGTGSLLGMLALLFLVFRSVRPLVLGLLSVGFGICTAVAVTLAVHGEMHLITLVFGASLIGEAIDYAVQYFAAHLGAGVSWEPMAGLRAVAPGIAVALATSLLGYGVLLFAPFPALSQIALFAFAGLFAAWLTVFLLLPALLGRPVQRDPAVAVAVPQRLLSWWQARVTRRVALFIAGLLLVVAVPGWLRLSGNDDVRQLVSRPPALVAQEERIRELIGFGGSGRFFLVEGETPDAVLQHEETLGQRLEGMVAQGDLGGYQSLSAFVPSSQRQAENHRLWMERVLADKPSLQRLFARYDLRDDIAERQIEGFRGSEAQLEEWLGKPMAKPFAHLWLGRTSTGYASLVVPQQVREGADLAAAVEGLSSVSLVDKTESISRLFREYRRWGALWLAGAVGLVFGVLCLRYAPRQAAVTLAPTILAIAMALAIFGYLDTPLTLFNLMALMLVLGIGVNYAIFLREGGLRMAATLAGVLLSAGTTLLSFGLLSFSSMPALSAFGLTLLIGVSIAVLLAPAVLTFAGKEAA